MVKFNIKMFFARRAFAKQREHFYESIANSMIRDGVPLLTCLQKLAQRNEDEKRVVSLVFRSWIKKMGDTASKGEFTTAIKKDIPDGDYMVLSGFDRSGKLAEGIKYQAGLIKKMKRMRSNFIMSMLKPIFSVLAMLCLSVFFATAAKGFLETAPMSKWPGPSQAMFKFTIFTSDYFAIMMITIISVVAWIIWAMPRWGKRFVKLRHKMDSQLPFVAYRDFTSFSTLIVLASLMSSGTPLKVACQMILDSGNPWVKSYFRKIVRRLGDTNMTTPVKAFDVGFFHKDIFYRVIDSSERGDFSEAIKKIAEDSFEDMEENMKKRAFIMDQLTTLVAGGIAALIALGLVSAIGAMQGIIKAASHAG